MPKSRRNRVVHMTQVSKKGREQKDQLFSTIREQVPEFQHVFVLSVENMRNNHLKQVRKELSDSRLFFGKTKLMSKALGQNPETALLDNINQLTPYISGDVGLLLTNRAPQEVFEFFERIQQADFARAGAVATRDFIIPQGVVYSTAGEVPRENDIPLEHSIEPELRKLGVPTRMVRGRVVLGDADAEEAPASEDNGGYVVCREGQTLDSRQTRLLKLFSVLLAEFNVKTLAYWSAASSEVTKVDA